MITLAAIASLIYGCLTLAGGILGYIKSRSTISLISGGISGLLLVGASILQLQGIDWAKWLAIAVTVLLIIVFVVRWIKTKKTMPAAIMVIVGVASLVMMIS